MEVKQNASGYLPLLSEISKLFCTRADRFDLLDVLSSRLRECFACRDLYCSTCEPDKNPDWFFAIGADKLSNLPPSAMAGAIARALTSRQLILASDVSGIQAVCPLLVCGDLVGLLAARFEGYHDATEIHQLLTIISAMLALHLPKYATSNAETPDVQVPDGEELINQERKLTAIIELARSIAHELNQPLTGITGYCTLIKETIGKDHAIAKDIDEIEKQAARLESLVYRFQNITHVEYNEKDNDDSSQLNKSE